MFISANVLQVVLCWALVAFSVSTVVVAVQNAKLNAELKDAKIKLDYLESELEGHLWPSSVRERENIDYRLPKAIVPIQYDLYLNPNSETGNFSGQEVIRLDVRENTKQIILHSHMLDIERVYVTENVQGDSLQVADFRLDPIREFLIIDMVNDLKQNTKVKLGILFNGRMEGKIVGLYGSSYFNSEQQQLSKLAVSKFEPTYARQAFPCFDEPAMKALFYITLVRPSEGYHALSNMNEENSQNHGETTEVDFALSVPMSTYVLCFLISDLAHRTVPIDTGGIGDDFDIRIFASEDQIDKVNFALITAVKVTEFYIQHFKVAYPLPKLDMAAIPDFGSNAMENWGLVTYREAALLYDKNISSTWNKQRVAAVVAHELAHMWFGNLVTLKWWNDLWLNEGFARFMEYQALDHVYPDWGMPDLFLPQALHIVMNFDASLASHPIVQTVENPDQITEIFDNISYEKGASIIRMLRDIVGVATFNEAVTNFLNTYAFGNAATGDFLTEMEKMNVDFDVKLIMRTWTEQMGFPVVDVQRISLTQFKLKQKRFLANIADYNLSTDDSEFNYTWSIPLTFYSDSQRNIQRLWFNYSQAEIIVTVPETTKWLKFNSHQIGYYRVNYEERLWRAIIADLIAQPKTFDTADRAHLLNDVFALADASQLSYDVALDMTTYLDKETDFVPWEVVATKLKELNKSLRNTDVFVDYQLYVRKLIAKIYKEVSWTVDENNHLKNRLRVTILGLACTVGLPECLIEATCRFNTWLAEPTVKPSPDLREVIYQTGIAQLNNQKVWENVFELFVAEKDANEKLKLMQSLAMVRSPWLLYRYIELAGNETYVRRHDYFTCLNHIASNDVGEPIVWNYIRENWLHLTQRFGLNDRVLGRSIKDITKNFESQTKLEEIQQFIGKYPEAGAGAGPRKQAVATVKYNMKWHELNTGKIRNWLKGQKHAN